MRKTTVLINEQLLKAAMEAVGARSKKEAIDAGLRSLVDTSAWLFASNERSE